VCFKGGQFGARFLTDLPPPSVPSKALVLKGGSHSARFFEETRMQQLQIPPLSEGEVYVGAIGDKNGDVQHIVLLPGDNERASWSEQLAWAKSIGGDLPTRVEQAMLFANCRDQFKEAAYWSTQEDTDDSGWAWCQYFGYGGQHDNHKTDALRARAVRRLSI